MGVQQINPQSNENIIVMQFIFVEEPKFLISTIHTLVFVAIRVFHITGFFRKTCLAGRRNVFLKFKYAQND